jgi:hypothetical protein
MRRAAKRKTLRVITRSERKPQSNQSFRLNFCRVPLSTGISGPTRVQRAISAAAGPEVVRVAPK